LSSTAGDALAVLQGDRNHAVAGRDLGERIEQRLEEVFPVLLAADLLQVGTDRAAFLGLDGVAGDAVGSEMIRDDVATGLDVAAFEKFGVVELHGGEFVLQTLARGGGFEDVELNGGRGLVLRELIEPMTDHRVVLRGRKQRQRELFGRGVGHFRAPEASATARAG
jgi:hypothetical protein